MKKYIDTQLSMFVALAIGASILSSHGAFQFFNYLVDPWLAWVFILVVALGIIGLDAAGTATRGPARWAYYGGMAFFLVLETLANYFAGQAGFVAQIVAKLPESSDLRSIAEYHPIVTRVLVVLFLSLASLAVAFFTFAATVRIQQIRAGVESGVVAMLRRILAQRRTTTRALVALARLLRSESASERLRAEQAERESAQLRSESAVLQARTAEIAKESAQLRTALEEARQHSAGVAGQLRSAQEQVAHESARVRTLSARLAEESARADALSAQLAEESAVLALDVRSIAARLRNADVSLRTTADALGVSEKTIRNWTAEKVEV